MRRLAAPSSSAAVLLAVLLAAGPAGAAQKVLYTYDSANAQARKLTGAGLTLRVETGMMHKRVLSVMATAAPVEAIVRGARSNAPYQALGDQARNLSLYEIDAGKAQGKAMIFAFCPEAKAAWIGVGRVDYGKPLHLVALADDGQGGARLCADMDFTFRAQWRLPQAHDRDRTEDVFQPSYEK